MLDQSNDFEDPAPAADIDAGKSSGAQSALDIPLALSFAGRVEDTRTVGEQFSLRELARLWAAPDTNRGRFSSAEYHALDKKDKAQKKIRDAEKNGQYFCPCTFQEEKGRADKNISKMSAFVLDFDSGKTTLADIQQRLGGLAYLAYTSYSHLPNAERWRVIIPYAAPVEVELHARVFEHFNALFDGDVDPFCETPSQPYYTPACPYDAAGDYQCILVDGAAFDPATLPDRAAENHGSDANSADAGSGKHPTGKADPDEVADALQHVDAENRKLWVKVGLALKHEFGDAGLRLYLDYSKRSEKFDLDDAMTRWDGYEPTGDITVGTIFHLAGQAGWVRTKVPDEIAELNEKYFLAHVGSKAMVFVEETHPVFKGKTVRMLAVNDFKNLYANKFMLGFDSKGKPTRVPLGKYWIEHAARRTYDGVIYSPGKTPARYYNLWQGFAVTPASGSWKRFRWHLYAIICRKKMRHYRYLLNWLAWAVQNPGKQGEVAVVLRGDKGTGKGVVARTMEEIFGVHAQSISNAKHLTGNFNGHLQNCSFLFVDEAFWAGDKQGEATLKQLITEPTVMHERKHVDAEKGTNCLHVMMAANNLWVVPATFDERRYFVLDVDPSRRQDDDYFNPLYAEIDNGGREAMLYDLLHRDLTRFNIRKVPQTGALGEQKLLSLDPGMTWWHGKLASGELIGAKAITSGPQVGGATAPVPWGQVEKYRLQDDYEKGMRGQFASRKGTEAALHWLLRHALPPGYPISRRVTLTPGGPQVGVYEFPPLQACRDRFEEHLDLKGQIDWANGGCVRGPATRRTQQIYVTGITVSDRIACGIRVGKGERPRRTERIETSRIVVPDVYRSVRRS